MDKESKPRMHLIRKKKINLKHQFKIIKNQFISISAIPPLDDYYDNLIIALSGFAVARLASKSEAITKLMLSLAHIRPQSHERNDKLK